VVNIIIAIYESESVIIAEYSVPLPERTHGGAPQGNLKTRLFMTDGKFLALWTKYLPAIRIMLKKALNEEQQITLSKMELQSVDNRKNVNFSFDLEISNGKIENSMGVPPMGKDLFSVLNGDPLVRNFMADKKISIQMSRASLLTFKCNLTSVVQ